MATDVLYLRNTRPNAVLFKLGEKPNLTKYVVERRGSREDTTAVPSEAINDPTVASFVQRGILEVIDKESFMALGERGDGRPAIPLVTRKAETEVAIPMADQDSRTFTVIADKDLEGTKEWRSPRPEFAGQVLTTPEELATGIVQPKNPGKANLPETKDEINERKISELTNLVAQQSQLLEKLLEGGQNTPTVEIVEVPAPAAVKKAPAKRKPAARKPATPRAKSTKPTE